MPFNGHSIYLGGIKIIFNAPSQRYIGQSQKVTNRYNLRCLPILLVIVTIIRHMWLRGGCLHRVCFHRWILGLPHSGWIGSSIASPISCRGIHGRIPITRLVWLRKILTFKTDRPISHFLTQAVSVNPQRLNYHFMLQQITI